MTQITKHLGLRVRTFVLQDSWGHFVVYLAQGKRLVTYRLDNARVVDAIAGKADQLDRIRKVVEQYLQQEFLGQATPPKTPPPASSGPAAAATAGAATGVVAGPGASRAAPIGSPPASGTAGGVEMSREERIAAAKAKAVALDALDAASGGLTSQQPPPDKNSVDRS
ncbi:MAG TPA: hypothetical protein VKZ50_08575 [bacterium]|nr:hypothetical protein [bacterium]